MERSEGRSGRQKGRRGEEMKCRGGVRNFVEYRGGILLVIEMWEGGKGWWDTKTFPKMHPEAILLIIPPRKD